jgi:hypothetical protein
MRWRLPQGGRAANRLGAPSQPPWRVAGPTGQSRASADRIGKAGHRGGQQPKVACHPIGLGHGMPLMVVARNLGHVATTAICPTATSTRPFARTRRATARSRARRLCRCGRASRRHLAPSASTNCGHVARMPVVGNGPKSGYRGPSSPCTARPANVGLRNCSGRTL